MKKVLACLLVALTFASGCTRRVLMSQERLIDSASFSKEDGPYYVKKKEVEKESPKYETLRVEEGTLLGNWKNYSKSGVDKYLLNDVEHVEIEEINPWTTTLAGIGIGGVILGVVVLALVESTISGSEAGRRP